MKRLSIIAILATLFILAFLFSVSAEDIDYLSWSSPETTVTVTMDTPQYYTYTPAESGKYAIKYLPHTPLTYEFHPSDDSYIGFTNWVDMEGVFYDIYELTAGVEYHIRFFYNGLPSIHGETYSGPVSIIPWDDSAVIPDYPAIQENEEKTITLANEEYAYYLFSPSVTGTYCLGQNESNIHVGLSPVSQKIGEEGHYPEDLGTWRTDTQQGSLHRLEAGNIYLVCISVFHNPTGNPTVSDTIWIRQGEAPKNDYEIWSIGESKTLILSSGENKKYYLTPNESGKYMVIKKTGLQFLVSDEEASFLGEEFMTSDGVQGYVFDLSSGQEYVVSISEWGSFQDSVSGTFSFQKVGPVTSASIYVANFYNEFYHLGLDIDPICGGLEGVTWSISDPSVFSFVQKHDNVAEIKILKSGQATVTATVGGVTASITLTSNPKLPVLTEGQALNMTIGGSAAEFTPERSGKYQFTVIPHENNRVQGREMVFSLFDNNNEDPVFHKSDFIDKLVFTVELDAGQKYELVQIFGRCSVTVIYTGASSGNQTPTTEPATSTTPPSTESAPSIPVETQPETNATEPSETAPTTPTQPTTEDVKPTDTQPDETPSGMVITDKEMSDAISNVSGNVLSFSLADTFDRTFEFSSGALQLAADKNCALSLEFPANFIIHLSEDIVKNLAGIADEEVQISVTPQSFGDMNESQQRAMDVWWEIHGVWGMAWLKDVNLMIGDEAIHQLGGKANITFPNKDTTEEWTVLYLAENGDIEVMDITCGEDISFTTEHFSHYILVSKSPNQSPVGNGNLSTWIAIPIVVVLLVGGTAAFLFLKKKGLISFKK